MILVTPPASPVVPLAELRAHLRVDGTSEDALIQSLEAAAVAYLDGWKGILGRAILTQTWAVDLPEGESILPMPDVTTATVGGQPLTLTYSNSGPMVTLTAPGTVQFTCGLPVTQLPVAVMIVKLLVAHWFYSREAVGPSNVAEVPMSASSLITAIRWRGV